MIINLPSEELAYKEIIDTIHRFTSCSHFFLWLGKDDLVTKILRHHLTHRTFEGLGDYFMDELKIFSGGCSFLLEHIPESFKNELHAKKPGLSHYLSSLEIMKKEPESCTLDGPNYTVIFKIYFQNTLCGSSWEIYDLKNLIKVFKKRKVYASASWK